MATIHGTCDERFGAVSDVLSNNIDSGADVGASVAIVKDGELVVDIWGGTISPVDGGPDRDWQTDTLINVYSTTKTMCNLSALICADRGLIDLHAPVATYWPEFKASGKENVTVAMLLGHTAGLSGFAEPTTKDDLYDWDIVCGRLAAQEPWWEPGTASGYHAVTQGFLVGEVVRRVTGRSLGTFFADEVAGPLGADFHIGTPAACDPRVAKLIPPADDAVVPMGNDPASPAYRTFTNPKVSAEESWTEAWRRAEIPAANGHGNARSVAQVQSIVSHHGQANGVTLLSPDGVDAIFEVQAKGADLVLGVPLLIGTGYGLISPDLPVAPTKRGCFWGGWGGSIVVNDLDNRMTIAYVMNKMGLGTTGDARGVGAVWAAYGALSA